VYYYYCSRLALRAQAVIRTIGIAEQQRDIAETIADSMISGSKKTLIHRDCHCCLWHTKEFPRGLDPAYDDANGNPKECQGRIEGNLDAGPGSFCN